MTNKLPNLSEENWGLVQSLMQMSKETVAMYTKTDVYPQDIKSIFPIDHSKAIDLYWLSTDVILKYMKLCQEKTFYSHSIFIMDPFHATKIATGGLYEMDKVYKDKQLFQYRLLLFPIIINMHWSLVSLELGKKKKVIQHWDSKGVVNESFLKNVKIFMSLHAFYLDNPGEKLRDIITRLVPIADVFCQKNDCDCGVMILWYSRCLMHKHPLCFSGEQSDSMRKLLIFELMTGEIVQLRENFVGKPQQEIQLAPRATDDKAMIALYHKHDHESSSSSGDSIYDDSDVEEITGMTNDCFYPVDSEEYDHHFEQTFEIPISRINTGESTSTEPSRSVPSIQQAYAALKSTVPNDKTELNHVPSKGWSFESIKNNFNAQDMALPSNEQTEEKMVKLKAKIDELKVLIKQRDRRILFLKVHTTELEKEIIERDKWGPISETQQAHHKAFVAKLIDGYEKKLATLRQELNYQKVLNKMPSIPIKKTIGHKDSSDDSDSSGSSPAKIHRKT